MSTCRKPILSRFSQPAKETLISMINYTNNRDITKDQLDFGIPKLISEDGLSRVPILFNDSTGWKQLDEELTYVRTRLSDVPGCSVLSIHSDDTDVLGLFEAVFEQYGLLLEEDTVTLTELDTYENGMRDYTLTFVDHLIFIGDVKLQVRPSLEFLGMSIGQLMDLRTFYLSGTTDKPPVDLYCHNGELLLDGVVVNNPDLLAHYELTLYSTLADVAIPTDSLLLDIMEAMTGDDWVHLEGPAPFNLNGAVVLYNGLRTEEYKTESARYAYVMVLELGPLCSNLQGLITIGYQYSLPNGVGGLLKYDSSANPPLITPR